MYLTYSELLEALEGLTTEQMSQTATVYVPGVDEFYPIGSIDTSAEDEDRLDPGHSFLKIA